jgi:hypothetical protein
MFLEKNFHGQHFAITFKHFPDTFVNWFFVNYVHGAARNRLKSCRFSGNQKKDMGNVYYTFWNRYLINLNKMDVVEQYIKKIVV